MASSIHNLLLFRQCRNYLANGTRVTERGSTTTVPEMADNDYDTFSSQNDIDIDISDGSSATRVDAIFIKYQGTLTEYTATPTGGTGSAVTRTVPTEIDDFDGNTLSLSADGFSHDLFLLDTHFTATSVRMQLTGNPNLEVTEIMLLELFQEVDANQREIAAIDPVSEDRAGQLDTGSGGALSRQPGIGNAREKRNLRLSLIVIPDETTITDVDEFVYALEVNKRLVVALPFSEDPTAVFPAIVSSQRISVRWRGEEKQLGYFVGFEVAEQ